MPRGPAGSTEYRVGVQHEDAAAAAEIRRATRRIGELSAQRYEVEARRKWSVEKLWRRTGWSVDEIAQQTGLQKIEVIQAIGADPD